MFEINFIFYIKHEIGFYDWLKAQNLQKANEHLGEGIRFLGIKKPEYGDVGRIHAQFELTDLKLKAKIHEASAKPGFLKELQSYVDNSRIVETTLLKKLI